MWRPPPIPGDPIASSGPTRADEAHAIGHAEAAVGIVADAEEIERDVIRRAARLLAPRLTFKRDSSGWQPYAETTLRSGPAWVLRMTGLPTVPGRPGTHAPEVLLWRYFDGTNQTDEPVAKLVKVVGPDAEYALLNTRAGRAFGKLLEDGIEPTVRLPLLLDGEPSRTAEVVFGE